jgi:hypothetical protein
MNMKLAELIDSVPAEMRWACGYLADSRANQKWEGMWWAIVAPLDWWGWSCGDEVWSCAYRSDVLEDAFKTALAKPEGLS